MAKRSLYHSQTAYIESMLGSEFPQPEEITDPKVIETVDTIKYSLAYPFRTHNNVARIIIHPRIIKEPQLVGTEKEQCKHEVMNKWKCEACGFLLQNYHNFLDYGEHLHFIEIWEQPEINFQFKTRIYRSYKAKNIVEMREYMMIILSNSLNYYDKTFMKVSRPKLSQKLDFYIKTRYDNWCFYASRVLPQKVLKFDSMFEGGNLDSAELVDLEHYVLTVNPDTNTYGNTQWFYYSVTNTTRNKTVNFKIINFIKAKSLYSKGMPIWIFSEQRHENSGTGWFQGGVNLFYYENSYHKPSKACSKASSYYTLSFDYTFEYEDDKVYFAYAHPYTYTRVCYAIHQLENQLQGYKTEELNALHNKFSKKEETTDPLDPKTPYPPFEDKGAFYLGEDKKRIRTNKIAYFREMYSRTLCGLPAFVLTITGDRKNGIIPEYQRKCVVLTARVHPCETAGSFMAEGFLKYIISDTEEARAMRDMFVFKVFLCLNPDGIVIGNSRTGVQGADLNRAWLKPNSTFHPIIYQVFRILKTTAYKRGILAFFDLHTHSTRCGTFMYGCPLLRTYTFSTWSRIHLIPRTISKLTELFSYSNCAYTIANSKRTTARVVLNKSFKVENSFTFEASAFGYYAKKGTESYIEAYKNSQAVEPYKMRDYAQIGAKLAESLFHYASIQKAVERVEKLSSSHLKIEKQLELAQIVAKSNSATFIKQSSSVRRAGITGFIERIKQRIKGARSVSPEPVTNRLKKEEESPLRPKTRNHMRNNLTRATSTNFLKSTEVETEISKHVDEQKVDAKKEEHNLIGEVYGDFVKAKDGGLNELGEGESESGSECEMVVTPEDLHNPSTKIQQGRRETTSSQNRLLRSYKSASKIAATQRIARAKNTDKIEEYLNSKRTLNDLLRITMNKFINNKGKPSPPLKMHTRNKSAFSKTQKYPIRALQTEKSPPRKVEAESPKPLERTLYPSNKSFKVKFEQISFAEDTQKRTRMDPFVSLKVEREKRKKERSKDSFEEISEQRKAQAMHLRKMIAIKSRYTKLPDQICKRERRNKITIPLFRTIVMKK